ncbi:hypothetical protein FA95DRAFT_1614402 [Auriscalpium vulgare]|uniref:Uncharacterized protein n=1 Tax=Auriscalpium vulgare TaxID=40419 RepID=A0ACB8R0X8_9AGAM|nr:hypothetical protein FA95DRAFT_1614402 [Auriscalpium vulgare]
MPFCYCSRCFPRKSVALGTLKKHINSDLKKLKSPENTPDFISDIQKGLALCREELVSFTGIRDGDASNDIAEDEGEGNQDPISTQDGHLSNAVEEEAWDISQPADPRLAEDDDPMNGYSYHDIHDPDHDDSDDHNYSEDNDDILDIAEVQHDNESDEDIAEMQQDDDLDDNIAEMQQDDALDDNIAEMQHDFDSDDQEGEFYWKLPDTAADLKKKLLDGIG